MQINVPLTNGCLADEYGKYAPTNLMIADHPIKSFPITITDVPAGTKSLALVFYDVDSTPVCGFPWIHWLAANIPATMTTIPANASRELADQFIQGKNSNAGALVNGDTRITQGYVGPQPPDETHYYTLRVDALDQMLPLENGYWLNDYVHATKGHLLASTSIDLPSRA